MVDVPNGLLFASDFFRGQLAYESACEVSGFLMGVQRGGMGFCAYIGIPKGHVMHSLEEFHVNCHRGLTYQSWRNPFTGKHESTYWVGWDYSHAGDYIEMGEPGFLGVPDPEEFEKKMMESWDLPEEVKSIFEEIWDNKNNKRFCLNDVVKDLIHAKEILHLKVEEAIAISTNLIAVVTVKSNEV